MALDRNLFTDEQIADLEANDNEIGLPVGTSAAQFMRESANNSSAVSKKGAMGFAQVMPSTLASLNKQLGRTLDPTNWQDSLIIQKTLMKQNMAHFGNTADALAAYNSGWDRTKWNNPETQAYVQALAGGASVSAPSASVGQGGNIDPNAGDPDNVFIPHFDVKNPRAAMTSIDKQMALIHGASDVMNSNASTANGNTMARPDLDTSLVEGESAVSGVQVAQETQHASMLGSLQQALEWNTLTGRMVDHFAEDAADPNFSLSTDDLKNFQQQHPQIWGNDEMRNYVVGASSASNLASRIDAANQHLDFMGRYSNTNGLAGAGDFLMQQVGAMADPVTLVATMGLGAGINAVRGGVEAGMAARFAGGAAEGAAVNAALGQQIAGLDNQEYGWKDVVGQAVAGSALGALGSLIHTRSKLTEKDPGVKPDGVDHAAHGAVETANSVVDQMTAKAAVETPGTEGRTAGTIDPHAPVEGVKTPVETSTNAGHVDAAVQRVNSDEARLAAEEEHAKAVEAAASGDAEKAAAVAKAEDDAAGRTVAPGVEHAVRAEDDAVEQWAQTWGVTTADAARDARNGKRATWVSDAATELEKLANSAANPLIRKLAAHLKQFVRDPAKIIAQPLDKDGNPIRSAYRLTSHTITLGEDLSGNPLKAKPNGMTNEQTMLHEITHSLTAGKIEYGLQHPDTVHGQLVKQLDAIRKAARRQLNKESELAGQKSGYDEQAQNRIEHASRYYLTNLHEFSAGLFSGEDHFLQLLRRTGAGKAKSSLLSKAVDVIRTLLGMDPTEVNGLTHAMGLHDQLLERKLNIKAGQKIVSGQRAGEHSVRDVFLDAGVHSRDEIPLGPLAQSIEPQLVSMGTKPMPKELEKARARAQSWYSNWRGYLGPAGKALGLLDSPGVTLGQSKNGIVRAVANMLIEDATGASRAGGTSAAIDKVAMASNWRTPMANLWNQLSPELMTARERTLVQAGLGDEVLKRIGKQVQEERLQSRNARLAGTEYESQAHPAVKKLAAAMDGMFKDITEKGTAAGESRTTKIGKSGWQGYVPYRFDDGALRTLYRDSLTDPEKAATWNNLMANFRTQYVAKLTEPMRQAMSKQGPADAAAVLERVTKMAEDRTNDYFTQIMRDQGGRVLGADDHFANVAAKMLDDVRALNGNKATRLTKQLISDFRKNLADTISDKSRTEFDLLHNVNGVRMLDYIDTDFGRMVEQNTSHYAGAIALAKRGIKDDNHWQAFRDVLVKHGATDDEMKLLDFAHTALTDGHDVTENAAAHMLQSATSLSLMGKVGLNALGDAGALVGSVGMGGFLKSFVGSLGKETELMKQLKVSATSALGLDHRIKMGETSKSVTPHTGSMLTDPMMYRNLSKGVNTALSWMSLARPIQMMTHRAAVPAITEELVSAIRGAKFDGEGNIIKTGSGTLTPARLVDTGLNAERVRAIQELLETHDAGRKAGEQINWTQWDKTNPGYAEDFIGAIHRVTGQVLQRAFIGEQPRWAVETAMGRFFTQFRQQGMLGAEKQLARNMSHADGVTATTFAFNAAWSAGLYYAKTMASTASMSDSQRDEYLQKKFHGLELASGVASMTNISGIASDALDATNTMFGGQSNGTSPFASMGYLKNVGTAAGKIGGQITGDENADIHKTVASVARTLPLGNTFLGTAALNALGN